jgi:hypothetical protein
MMELKFTGNIGDLPTSQFVLTDQGKEVGLLQLRHQPSHSKELPARMANHVYCEIYPEFRGQGFRISV